MDRNHRELLMRIIIATFLIASLGALASCGGGGGGGGGNPPVAKSGDVIWTKTVDPSVSQDDEIYGVAVDGTAVYAVGFDSYTILEDDQWRIEKRSLSDGTLVSSFGSSGVVVTNPSTTSIFSYDDANAIAIDSTFMYVVGFDTAPDLNPDNSTLLNNDEWRIEKLSLSTGVSAYTVTSNPSAGSDEANAIAIDAAHDHMYVVGFDSGGANGSKEWRIEKRYLSTGLTVTSFGPLFDGVITSETSSFSDVAKTIAIDDTYMYVGGYQANLSDRWEWRTEKRSLSTGETVTAFGANGVVSLPSITGDAIISSIAVDTQSMYTAGYVAVDNFTTAWRIEKRDKITGNLDTTFNTTGSVVSSPTSTGSNAPKALVMDTDYLYIAGYDTNTTGSKRAWRIEKRNKSDGALVTSFATGGVYRNHPSATSITPGDDDIWAITVDSDYLYVVGYDSVPGTRQWRIEKIVK